MRAYVTPLAIGFVGCLLAFGCWHLYTDHVQHHALWDLELRRAAAQQAAQATGGT